MKRFLSVLLWVVPALFMLSYMMLIQQRHDIQELNTKRDKLRGKNHHLRDVNRNLQLEYSALFDSDKMQVLSERLGMVEPSLADGNLFYWEEKP